jgi:hypothetical protein
MSAPQLMGASNLVWLLSPARSIGSRAINAAKKNRHRVAESEAVDLWSG